MPFHFSRQSLLIVSTVFLLGIFAIQKFFFSGDGITIRVKERPLYEVLASIKKQGGIPVHSNLAPDTPVTLDIENAPLQEVMESLAVNLDARWSHYFALGPDKGAALSCVADLETEKPSPATSVYYRPIPGMMAMVSADFLPDPRKMTWVVDAVDGKQDMQTLLEAMASGSDAGFVAPADWNPQISELPDDPDLEDAVDDLADAGHGKMYSFLFLSGRGGWGGAGGGPRPAEGGGGPRPEGGPVRREGFSFNDPLFEKRVELRLSELPAEDQESARQEWQQQKQLFAELRNLVPEQRRERFRELMDDPKMQEKMEEAAEKRDSRRSPEARKGRYRNYLGRKAAAKGGA